MCQRIAIEESFSTAVRKSESLPCSYYNFNGFLRFWVSNGMSFCYCYAGDRGVKTCREPSESHYLITHPVKLRLCVFRHLTACSFVVMKAIDVLKHGVGLQRAMTPWPVLCCNRNGFLCVWVSNRPSHAIAITNIEWCMAYTRGVGGGVVYGAIDVQYDCNSAGNTGGRVQ